MKPQRTAHQTIRDSRTYHVSDERLKQFGKLSYAQRLQWVVQWVKQCAQFARLAQHAQEEVGSQIAQGATSLSSLNGTTLPG